MKQESFELYHKSGVRRTIRLKAWGFSKNGLLVKDEVLVEKSFGSVVYFGSKKAAATYKARGEKIIELEVTIKATKKTG